MISYPSPRIFISSCLEQKACRYNGQVIPDAFVKKVIAASEVLTACPEEAIGLGTPRDPVRVATDENGTLQLYQPATGTVHTKAMRSFTEEYLDALPELDGFLLKYGSPSCGPGGVKVYIGMREVKSTTKGAGFFGAAVRERFPDLPVEDEGRLKNFRIREHFLTSIYTLARYREAVATGSYNSIVAFHTTHKLLLMGYNQSRMREMGRLLADRKNSSFDELTVLYGEMLRSALYKIPREQSMINVLEHALGGFKKVLRSDEKRFFLNSIEEYRDERIPLSSLLFVLKAWAQRFENSYLLDQTFMDPYPKQLVDIHDSGKGRDL